MKQNSNYITFEMNIKFSMSKDYRLILGSKKTWIVAAIVIIFKLILYAIKIH